MWLNKFTTPANLRSVLNVCLFTSLSYNRKNLCNPPRIDPDYYMKSGRCCWKLSLSAVLSIKSFSICQFLEGATIEVDQIHTHMRPLLMMLGDYRSLTLNVVNRLTSVTRLFPNSFNDKFCDQMMVSKVLSPSFSKYALPWQQKFSIISLC